MPLELPAAVFEAAIASQWSIEGVWTKHVLDAEVSAGRRDPAIRFDAHRVWAAWKAGIREEELPSGHYWERADVGQQWLAERLGVTQEEIAAACRAAFPRVLYRWYELRWRRFFEVVPHETQARRSFERLARVTYRYTRRFGAMTLLRFPDERIHREDLREGYVQKDGVVAVPRCPKLADRWQGWQGEWAALLSRHPRLQLREALRAIGETSAGEAWPRPRDRELIRLWARAGRYQRLPLDDEQKILNEAFHRRLRELWQQSGGWFYWDDALFMGIFAPDAASPQNGKL